MHMFLWKVISGGPLDVVCLCDAFCFPVWVLTPCVSMWEGENDFGPADSVHSVESASCSKPFIIASQEIMGRNTCYRVIKVHYLGHHGGIMLPLKRKGMWYSEMDTPKLGPTCFPRKILDIFFSKGSAKLMAISASTPHPTTLWAVSPIVQTKTSE